MKRDPVSTLVAAILLLSVTAAAGLCYWFLQNSRQHQILQSEVARVNRNRALLQSLGNEMLEYGKRNPSMLPVLQSVGVRVRNETNSTPNR